ncbi:MULTISPECIES: citrulline utilization hydrolase CtlX [unclassified Leeuwenhoekiella]|mgnify:CR=1 FL=1|uniref:citrulline utilization hydrolase CtlX n=1 Tax=unclassified Leeuwenhoekiella TaxID=2615029 RepID=UPI000C461965|nr:MULTISPECIES: arginine deiminase-related protein [unclassified Leeuwenhoekiella]MAW95741.1 amidinotransferase [Leeuwenhoekiella sp.]MBA81184.1 amidinotransferase [Leeuwenhoekiella sp.]|tara:strand:+ start:8689 stop:9621 length:933 start_codon:yes stop_codon:yes gene_type:complete
MKQITNTLLMVRPAAFRMNEQTAVNNYFQEELSINNEEINAQAQQEFDAFVLKLRSQGIEVLVLQDQKELDTPDSIFPNNWVSTHENGNVAVYPMYAENRRKERREEFFELIEESGFKINSVVDYTEAEEEGIFLEGTGSIVLDRQNERAYCALSARADEELFIEFCEDFEYFPVVFTANQTVNGKRLPIYHTNVMMCIAEEFCVICLDTIDDKKERKLVIDQLKKTGKEIIAISEEQMHQFAGNMLQVKNDQGEKFLVMSASAHNSLNAQQTAQISKYCQILSSDLNTIETCGGGSARCMMAEIFLPKN